MSLALIADAVGNPANAAFEDIANAEFSPDPAHIDGLTLIVARSRRNFPFKCRRKFVMVINVRTAKGLGITASPSILATADEVIQ